MRIMVRPEHRTSQRNLDDINAITRAITEDVAAHDGGAAAQRSADDTYYTDATGVVRYSSLRDPTLITRIAQQRGVR